MITVREPPCDVSFKKLTYPLYCVMINFYLFIFSVRIRESKYLPAQRRRHLQSSMNLSRSQRNLLWLKSKFKSLRSNLEEASVQLKNNSNDGLCDPYVTLRLVPGQKFNECPKHKSRCQRRTLFPLFDETFDL